MTPADEHTPIRPQRGAGPEPRPGELPPAEVAVADIRTVPVRRFLAYLLGLDTWGFGGPIATVGYMQRDLVERRGWLTRQDFLDGVALGQAMPGPLAAQVVMWLGFLRGRTLSALAAAVAFVAPSVVLVLAVAVVYARYQGLAIVQALLYGIAPAVMAIIAIADRAVPAQRGWWSSITGSLMHSSWTRSQWA